MAAATKRNSRKTKEAARKSLILPAIEIRQGRGRKVFAFAVNGKLLSRFTTVTRIARDNQNKITGYQRPEVLSHISQIRRYLESNDPMLPNAIVVAFDDNVRFTPSTSTDSSDGRPGHLTIPLCSDDETPVGLIVDGQQRTAALRDADIDGFPVFVVGFVAKDQGEQREQFLLVNSAKPLPKGLLYELLPSIDAPLPDSLSRRRFPAELLARLNNERDSPFCGLINTPTSPSGVVKDNSILRMIENSLSDGALFPFRDPVGATHDDRTMLNLLKNFWSAVRDTFPDAWGQPPKKSRLMHGAGIIAMGFVMDAIADRYRKHRVPSVTQFGTHLATIKSECRWTHGFWSFGKHHTIKWCDLQNTTSHIQILTDYLLLVLRGAQR